MNVSSREFAAALSARLMDARAELARLESVRVAISRSHKQTLDELEAARAELAATLLPAWDPGVFQTCAQWVGLPRLATAPFENLEKDRQKLEKELAAIRAKPAYIQRQELADLETGSLVLRLRDLQANCEALYPFTRPCESHPRWQRLLESGYGTQRYNVPWWRLSYYSDWKAGDEVVERFPGKEFPEILKHYDESRSALNDLERSAAAVMRELEQVRELERQYQEKSHRLAHLAEIHLAETCQNMLIPHLNTVPMETLLERFRAWPAVFPLVARFSGLLAKKDYLKEIDSEKNRPLEVMLRGEVAKLQTKLMKVNRPKKAYRTYPKVQVDAMRQRSQKVMNNIERTRGMVERVGGFNAWNVVVPAAGGLLWWDLMTDGRINGDFLPSVRDFRKTHPEYRYQREKERSREFEEAAAETEIAEVELRDDFS